MTESQVVDRIAIPPDTSASPFDGLAASYDRLFTDSRIGRRMREAVWRRMDMRFEPGFSILDVGCGTGEDAANLAERGVRVLATDACVEMLRLAQRKIESRQVGHLATCYQLAIEDIATDATVQEFGPFDGFLANFGCMNCVTGVSSIAKQISAVVRPGGMLIVCVMGPVVPWEWVWFFAHGEPRKAFRRLRGGGVEWRGMTVRYPSIREMRAAFDPYCRVLRMSALGALMPPPFAESWAVSHPNLTSLLARIERRWETTWPNPLLADHYVIEMERR